MGEGEGRGNEHNFTVNQISANEKMSLIFEKYVQNERIQVAGVTTDRKNFCNSGHLQVL